MEQEEIINFLRSKRLILFIFLIFFLIGFLWIIKLFYDKGNLRSQKEIQIENLENRNLEKNPEIVINNKYKEMIDKISFDQKIGQVLLTSLDSEVLSDYEINLLKEGSVSGFLLFSKNIKDKKQLMELTAEIYRVASEAGKLIPIIAIDQEGGRVSRIDFVEKTSQEEIKTEEEVYKIALERGKQLKELGIWMNFSPVVECNDFKKSEGTSSAFLQKSLNNFINKQNRGFLENCENLVLAMINGYKQGGVLGVAKHFPDGLLYTDKDPHQELPIVEINRENLILSGYKTLIDNNLQALMITHLRYPNIDENITSKSKIFISEILRKELGFRGMVVIDDLSMKAVSDNDNLGEFVVESVKNGADLFIISDRENYDEVFRYLTKEGREDQEFKEKIDKTVEMVIRTKEKYSLSSLSRN